MNRIATSRPTKLVAIIFLFVKKGESDETKSETII